MESFSPLHDRVLLRRKDAEEKSPGGIIIPDTVKEKPVEAKVVAIGAGRPLEDGTNRPLYVRVGDLGVLHDEPDATIPA